MSRWTDEHDYIDSKDKYEINSIFLLLIAFTSFHQSENFFFFYLKTGDIVRVFTIVLHKYASEYSWLGNVLD